MLNISFAHNKFDKLAVYKLKTNTPISAPGFLHQKELPRLILRRNPPRKSLIEAAFESITSTSYNNVATTGTDHLLLLHTAGSKNIFK